MIFFLKTETIIEILVPFFFSCSWAIFAFSCFLRLFSQTLNIFCTFFFPEKNMHFFPKCTYLQISLRVLAHFFFDAGLSHPPHFLGGGMPLTTPPACPVLSTPRPRPASHQTLPLVSQTLDGEEAETQANAEEAAPDHGAGLHCLPCLPTPSQQAAPVTTPNNRGREGLRVRHFLANSPHFFGNSLKLSTIVGLQNQSTPCPYNICNPPPHL